MLLQSGDVWGEVARDMKFPHISQLIGHGCVEWEGMGCNLSDASSSLPIPSSGRNSPYCSASIMAFIPRWAPSNELAMETASPTSTRVLLLMMRMRMRMCVVGCAGAVVRLHVYSIHLFWDVLYLWPFKRMAGIAN